MADKKKYYGEDKSMNNIFPDKDSKKPAGNIPVGGTSDYKTGMEYTDQQIRKNSGFKKNTN